MVPALMSWACTGPIILTSAHVRICSVWLWSKLCNGEASTSVVVVKSGVGLGMPLRLYKYISSTNGRQFITYVHRVVSSLQCLCTLPLH